MAPETLRAAAVGRERVQADPAHRARVSAVLSAAVKIALADPAVRRKMSASAMRRKRKNSRCCVHCGNRGGGVVSDGNATFACADQKRCDERVVIIEMRQGAYDD